MQVAACGREQGVPEGPHNEVQVRPAPLRVGGGGVPDQCGETSPESPAFVEKRFSGLISAPQFLQYRCG